MSVRLCHCEVMPIRVCRMVTHWHRMRYMESCSAPPSRRFDKALERVIVVPGLAAKRMLKVHRADFFLDICSLFSSLVLSHGGIVVWDPGRSMLWKERKMQAHPQKHYFSYILICVYSKPLIRNTPGCSQIRYHYKQHSAEGAAGIMSMTF